MMRQHLLASFDSFWIDVLNGSSRETGKRTPDGEADPSVFSTPFNREGIKVGTAIGLMVRGTDADKKNRSRDLWGATKRQDLLDSLNAPDFDAQYEEAYPAPENFFALRPRRASDDYKTWAPVDALCAVAPSLGLLENRQDSLIAIDRESLEARMRKYFDANLSFEELRKAGHGFTKPFARFNPATTRQKAIEAGGFNEASLQPYSIRAFDTRWCYYSAIRPLWNESRPTLVSQNWDGNAYFISRKTHTANPEGAPFYFASTLGSQDSMRGHSYYFPIQLRHQVLETLEIREAGGSLEQKMRTETTANLSPLARKYLSDLGLPDPDADRDTAALLWRHALAIGYSPLYRDEHAGGLASDWPRVPLPADADTLRKSAQLGEEVAVLLDVAQPVAGIETGTFRRELEPFGMLARRDGSALEDGDAALRLSENWGFFGERGIVQPGSARPLERDPNSEEKTALQKLGVPEETPMLKVPLNADASWQGVPKPVWEMIIGGYPVLKKWLSYRDERVLGRALGLDEAQQVENMVRRLTLLWSLQATLDANYQACALDTRPLDAEANEAEEPEAEDASS